MGEQKITLNFNKLQAVASLPIICIVPQAAVRLDAIRVGGGTIPHSKQRGDVERGQMKEKLTSQSAIVGCDFNCLSVVLR